MSDLKPVFDALTPENIKNIPLMQDVINAFLVCLEQNALVSIDIKNLYDYINPKVLSSVANTTVGPTTIPNENLRNAIIDVYLVALKNALIDAQTNKTLQNKIKLRQKEQIALLNTPITNMLNSTQFSASKKYKESVGTIHSINYMYSLAKLLEASDSNGNPIITEASPFHFVIEGGISKELYSTVVDPLSHPLGYTYSYKEVVSMNNLVDLFGLTKVFNPHPVIEIRGADGTYRVFTDYPDIATAKPILQQVFTTNRTNLSTFSLFTVPEFNDPNIVTIIPNKTVKSIIDDTTISGRYVEVVFTDNSVIKQINTNAQIDVTYYDANTGLTSTYSPTAAGHYSVYIDAPFSTTFNYTDTIASNESFNITNINDATGKPSNPPVTSDIINMSTDVIDNTIVTINGNGLPYLTTNQPGANGVATNNGFYIVAVDPFAQANSINQGFYLTTLP